MHGTERRELERWVASPLCSPQTVFAGFRINASRHATAFTLSSTGPFARDDLSLPSNGCPLRGLHSRINVPGLPLRETASRFHCPFGLSTPQPLAGSPRRKADSTLLARCSFPGRLHRLPIQPPLP